MPIDIASTMDKAMQVYYLTSPYTSTNGTQRCAQLS